MPPLRDRQEDSFQLISWFCKQLNEQFQTDRSFSQEAVACLQDYHWPGNVRELEVMLKRLFISTTGRQISAAAVEKELQKSQVLNQETAIEFDNPSENLSHAVEGHLARYFRLWMVMSLIVDCMTGFWQKWSGRLLKRRCIIHQVIR